MVLGYTQIPQYLYDRYSPFSINTIIYTPYSPNPLVNILKLGEEQKKYAECLLHLMVYLGIPSVAHQLC